MHGEELLLFKNSETTKSQEVGKTLVILVMNFCSWGHQFNHTNQRKEIGRINKEGRQVRRKYWETEKHYTEE